MIIITIACVIVVLCIFFAEECYSAEASSVFAALAVFIAGGILLTASIGGEKLVRDLNPPVVLYEEQH